VHIIDTYGYIIDWRIKLTPFKSTDADITISKDTPSNKTDTVSGHFGVGFQEVKRSHLVLIILNDRD
jgi:hypothetical protein